MCVFCIGNSILDKIAQYLHGNSLANYYSNVHT